MTLWLCTAVNSESVSPESDQSYSRETYVSLTTMKRNISIIGTLSKISMKIKRCFLSETYMIIYCFIQTKVYFTACISMYAKHNVPACIKLILPRPPNGRQMAAVAELNNLLPNKVPYSNVKRIFFERNKHLLNILPHVHIFEHINCWYDQIDSMLKLFFMLDNSRGDVTWARKCLISTVHRLFVQKLIHP